MNRRYCDRDADLEGEGRIFKRMRCISIMSKVLETAIPLDTQCSMKHLSGIEQTDTENEELYHHVNLNLAPRRRAERP